MAATFRTWASSAMVPVAGGSPGQCGQKHATQTGADEEKHEPVEVGFLAGKEQQYRLFLFSSQASQINNRGFLYSKRVRSSLISLLAIGQMSCSHIRSKGNAMQRANLAIR
jgi:hypothetical protein